MCGINVIIIIIIIIIIVIISHRRVILHLSPKFHRDRKIGGGIMTSYRFFSWQHTVGNVHPGSGLVTASV